jgi:hypothetical protein
MMMMGPRSRRLVKMTRRMKEVALAHQHCTTHTHLLAVTPRLTVGYLSFWHAALREQLKYHKQSVALQPYLPGNPHTTKRVYSSLRQSIPFVILRGLSLILLCVLVCGSAFWGGVDSGEAGLC